MLENLKIKSEFKANVYAHSVSFLVNIIGYTITSSFFFIWLELASLCFIGFNNVKSKSFFDHNIRNHFITVMLFYAIAHFALRNHIAYLILISIFTYIYFILKDNGFNKSFQLWMYIQALLIGTTLINFSFEDKISATVLGYLEAQLILNITLSLFKNDNLHEKEPSYFRVLRIPLRSFISLKNKTVLLAIRGAISAGALYALCISLNDLKPNWAVVVLISCLQRDDNDASMRVIKGTTIGSVIGWPVSIAILSIFAHNITLCTLFLWLLIIVTFVLSLEQLSQPTLNKQILLTVLFLAILTAVATCLHSGGYTYVHLKIFNSLIGALTGFCALWLWNKFKICYKKSIII